MLLYYIIHEFTLLLKLNEGYMKSNICNFLVEFIDRIFFRYNTENLYINNDIKRFMYILKSVGFLKENEEEIKSETQGFYEEYVEDEEETEDTQENKIDEEEEQDAIDMDVDVGDMEEGFASTYDNLVEFQESY